MARRRISNFGDLNTWINNIKSEVAEAAREEIVIKNLQIEGPYWSGEFAGQTGKSAM